MTENDMKIYSQFLYEILIQRKSDILEHIKSLKLSAISDSLWNRLSKSMMCDINDKLIEWEINIPSFNFITSTENASESFRYLVEIVQNENKLNFDKINEINLCLKKPMKLETIFDCFEPIPELIEKLERSIDDYNLNPDARIQNYKSMKDFATSIYLILTKLGVSLRKFHENDTSELIKSIEETMNKLIKISLVISDYPPKLIKKKTQNQAGTHFNATISSLIENEKIFSSNIHVQVYFLSEDNLQNFINTQILSSEWKINNSDVRNTSNNWILKNMIWDPQFRQSKERRKPDRITNLKAIILFRIKISATPYGARQSFDISTDLFSDTVISVVHTNQEIDAQLTLFWDEYFRIDKQSILKIGRFTCRDSVMVAELTQAISNYFAKQTSRGLTQLNQRFLEQKLLPKVSNGFVTFNSFTRNHMQDSELSFGHWVFQIIKLLKIEGIISMWKNDLIDGFVPKDSVSHFFNCPKGTFYLRFSERNPKIGVVVKAENRCDAWSPFSMDECRCRGLPERLMDYNGITYIRDANGVIRNKVDCLSAFIDDKAPDEGYTQRGRLLRLLEGNMYMDEITIPDDMDFPEEMDFPDELNDTSPGIFLDQ